MQRYVDVQVEDLYDKFLFYARGDLKWLEHRCLQLQRIWKKTIDQCPNTHVFDEILESIYKVFKMIGKTNVLSAAGSKAKYLCDIWMKVREIERLFSIVISSYFERVSGEQLSATAEPNTLVGDYSGNYASFLLAIDKLMVHYCQLWKDGELEKEVWKGICSTSHGEDFITQSRYSILCVPSFVKFHPFGTLSLISHEAAHVLISRYDLCKKIRNDIAAIILSNLSQNYPVKYTGRYSKDGSAGLTDIELFIQNVPELRNLFPPKKRHIVKMSDVEWVVIGEKHGARILRWGGLLEVRMDIMHSMNIIRTVEEIIADALACFIAGPTYFIELSVYTKPHIGASFFSNGYPSSKLRFTIAQRMMELSGWKDIYNGAIYSNILKIVTEVPASTYPNDYSFNGVWASHIDCSFDKFLHAIDKEVWDFNKNLFFFPKDLNVDDVIYLCEKIRSWIFQDHSIIHDIPPKYIVASAIPISSKFNVNYYRDTIQPDEPLGILHNSLIYNTRIFEGLTDADIAKTKQ